MTTKRKAVPGLTGEVVAATARSMCQRFGLKVAHFPKVPITRGPRTYWLSPVQWDGKGWLDLFIIDPLGGGVLVREAKGDREAPTPEQLEWMAWWRVNGFDVDFWRPVDLRSGRIEQELRAMVARRPARLATSEVAMYPSGVSDRPQRSPR